MNAVLEGLAANPALPPDLLARLVRLAVRSPGTGGEEPLWLDLRDREDLSRDQVLALAAHDAAAGPEPLTGPRRA
ncbi:hypothetical protein [Streptomyces sp. NPDC047976]|uniref:hypothetical protein n=1 Tax=Streptomyces sp. NPDC047976 TaxID=3155746 RepID=UPI003440A5A6